MIGQRTSAALQAKITQGWKPRQSDPLIPALVRRKIVRLHRSGVSQRGIAEQLNREGVPVNHHRSPRNLTLAYLGCGAPGVESVVAWAFRGCRRSVTVLRGG